MTDVLRLAETGTEPVNTLLARFGLHLEQLPLDVEIPGSYWKEEEAGIIGLNVLVRPDTPIHSILHESSHTICMDKQRRQNLHTDAGGETDEEDAVCYLQILLADLIPGMGRNRMLQDMDTWGYTFRLGSAANWFQQDAEDAQEWLVRHGLLTSDGQVVFTLRQ